MLVPYLTSGGNEHEWYMSYIQSAIDHLITKGVEISTSGSKGGYLSVFQYKPEMSPRPEYVVACGAFPEEKRSRYLYNSIEKAVRLNGNVVKGHTTSRESANPDVMEYPGAIYAKDLKRIFSFSGLEPQWDEFLSVMISCFSQIKYNRSKGKEPSIIQEVPELFENRIALITATDSEKEMMQEALDFVIQWEMSSLSC